MVAQRKVPGRRYDQPIETLTRCLINTIGYDRRNNGYVVDVLQADSANLATSTGIGRTLYLSKENINEGLAKFELSGSCKKLIGAPLMTVVTTGVPGGGVLGRSRFSHWVY